MEARKMRWQDALCLKEQLRYMKNLCEAWAAGIMHWHTPEGYGKGEKYIQDHKF